MWNWPYLDFENTDLYKKYNAELMEAADPEKISSTVSQQVALVGSQSLYERINTNFKEGRFDAFYAKVKLDICIVTLSCLSMSLSGTFRPVPLEGEFFQQSVWFLWR